MMARYADGRPGSSRRVRLVPVRQSGMDHRAMARIVLALARQMAAEADETLEPEVGEAASSGVGACAKREPGTSDGSAAARDDAAQSAAVEDEVSSDAVACTRNEPGTSDGQAAASGDAAVPWAGAHSGQSARGIASVGRCGAERLPSCCHTSAHHSPHEEAAPSSTPGGTP